MIVLSLLLFLCFKLLLGSIPGLRNVEVWSHPESWEILRPSARFFMNHQKLSIISSKTTGNWTKMFARSRGTERKVQAESFELERVALKQSTTVGVFSSPHKSHYDDHIS